MSPRVKGINKEVIWRVIFALNAKTTVHVPLTASAESILGDAFYEHFVTLKESTFEELLGPNYEIGCNMVGLFCSEESFSGRSIPDKIRALGGALSRLTKWYFIIKPKVDNLRRVKYDGNNNNN